MADERPDWQKIGEEFIQLYYSRFDTGNRSSLGELYVSLSSPSVWAPFKDMLYF
jgi:hypothetical protein